MEELDFDSIEPEKAFIFKFESLPVLWDSSNQHYSNKFIRSEALDQLLPAFKRLKPLGTVNDVRKKINTLRSNYRRELRKILLSKREGNGAVYTPKSWSFPYLTFLGTMDTLEGGRKLLKCNKSTEQTTDSESEDAHLKMQVNVKQELSPPTSPVSESPPLTLSAPKLKIQSTGQDYQEEFMPQNDCKHLVLEWVNILDRLDPLQRLYAKKAINDVLFEAELGNLTRYSVRINKTNDPLSDQSQSTSFSKSTLK